VTRQLFALGGRWMTCESIRGREYVEKKKGR
jgi:hypothetical protein